LTRQIRHLVDRHFTAGTRQSRELRLWPAVL
jgi:hypothetical protein